MNTAFECIKQGLQEAIAHARGADEGVRLHHLGRMEDRAVGSARMSVPQEQVVCELREPQDVYDARRK